MENVLIYCGLLPNVPITATLEVADLSRIKAE
jgi:hypothetical protein